MQIFRKASEELATLRDVYDGYHRYITSAEQLSYDPQKLNLQVETNKVKLKGMNSYESRLNELKNTTKQLDNRDLIAEIEILAQKWTETYAQISKLYTFILFNFNFRFLFFY